MPSDNSAVLVAFDLASEISETLQSGCGDDANLHYVTEPALLQESLERLRPEVVFSIKGPNFPAARHRPIMECPSVKWVHVGGSGYDHLLPWDRDRLTVTNCSGVLSKYLAETVTGGMLALNGNLLAYHRLQQHRMWAPREFPSLSDQTLLIVGLGHIGRCVADNAKALGMRVIGIRREQLHHPSVDVLAPPEKLPELIGEADVVTVHVRLNRETESLFGADMFRRMKEGALFMNTSRGKVVDEIALAGALESGRLRGAYLDVFEEEPLPDSSPLWSMPNVLVTPHCADDIIGWHRKFAELFVQNFHRWTQGEKLLNLV